MLHVWCVFGSSLSPPSGSKTCAVTLPIDPYSVEVLASLSYLQQGGLSRTCGLIYFDCCDIWRQTTGLILEEHLLLVGELQVTNWKGTKGRLSKYWLFDGFSPMVVMRVSYFVQFFFFSCYLFCGFFYVCYTTPKGKSKQKLKRNKKEQHISHVHVSITSHFNKPLLLKRITSLRHISLQSRILFNDNCNEDSEKQ